MTATTTQYFSTAQLARGRCANAPQRSALGVDAGMTRLTRLCRAVGVGLAVATATLAMTQEANAALPPPKIQPDQAAIQVPPTNVAFLVGHATGTQNYQCTASADNTTFTWKFVGPEAKLVTGGQNILHSAGPNGPTQPKWAADDGSAVFGAKQASATSPSGAIPWLLLSTTPVPETPAGLLTGTTFIQRVNTSGGVQPPDAECNAEAATTTKKVDYKADYYFYKAAGKSNPPGKPGA